MADRPPLIIDSAKVLEYAIVDSSVEYTGKCALFVGGELLGEVPKLALCQNYKATDFLLFHCNEAWEVLGAGGYPSVEEAKRSCEKSYKGIANKWIMVAKPNDFENWPGELEPLCSFCGKSFYEIEKMFEGQDAYICNECVSQLKKNVESD